VGIIVVDTSPDKFETTAAGDVGCCFVIAILIPQREFGAAGVMAVASLGPLEDRHRTFFVWFQPAVLSHGGSLACLEFCVWTRLRAVRSGFQLVVLSQGGSLACLGLCVWTRRVWLSCQGI
jgi:hypothetical protein